MKDNEIALRSQQLSEQTGAREADALARQSAVFQRLPDTVTGFQQASMAAQRQHEEMLHSASDLANDELKRKQAQEDLQWAQQLHTTTAMEYQTRALKANTEFEEARLAKAKRDLGNDVSYGEFGDLTDERKDNIIAGTGKKFIPGHGGVTIVDASQEEREAARGRLKLSRQEKMMSVALNAAYAGYVPDMEKGEFKYDPEAAKAIMERYQESRYRASPTAEARDITAETNMLLDDYKAAQLDIKAAQKVIDDDDASADEKVQAVQEKAAAKQRLQQISEIRGRRLNKVSGASHDATNPDANAPPPPPMTPQQEAQSLLRELQMLLHPAK